MTERAPAPPPGADYPPDFWGWVDAAAGRCTTEQVGTRKTAQEPSNAAAGAQPTVTSVAAVTELRTKLAAAKGFSARRELLREFAASYVPDVLEELARIVRDPTVQAEDRIKAALAILERNLPTFKEPSAALQIDQQVQVVLGFDLGNRFGRLIDAKPEEKP